MNTGVLTYIGYFFEYLVNNPYLLGIGILLYVFIFALSVLFSGPKPGRNPFSVFHLRPVEDIVSDQSIRDKVLKQRFKPNKVPQNLDAIIIGSGIGGMSTGVLLTRAGKKVLVLEQHDQAGGCCHTFHDKGYEFDTGVHYIGNCADGDDNKVFMDQLTGGRMEYPLMDEVFDMVYVGDSQPGKGFPFVSNKKKLQENLIKKFPKEEEGIKKFMQLLRACRGFMKGLFVLKVVPKWVAKLMIATGIFGRTFKSFSKYQKVSLQQVLDETFKDEELKATLSYCFGDYGVVPSKSPFGFHATLLNHYSGGSYYIRGGPSEVVLHMIPTIETNGGRVLVNAKVSEILMSGGKAVGVRVQRKEAAVDIYAKHIISDAGISNTFLHLLPKEIATKSCIYPFIQKVGESSSYVSVFVGLKGTKEELGLKAQNAWIFTGTNLEKVTNDYTALSRDEVVNAEVPLLFVSFPSAKDPTWEQRYGDKSTCLVITIAPYSWFSKWEDEKVKHRGDDYDYVKKAIGDQIWKQVVKVYPNLEDKVEYFDIGTPVSNKFYLGFQHGEIYGLDHTMDRFHPDVAVHLRPKTDIPGLYLTGQDILTCGFTGAGFGGLLCASEILHRNLYNDLAALKEQLKKKE